VLLGVFGVVAEEAPDTLAVASDLVDLPDPGRVVGVELGEVRADRAVQRRRVREVPGLVPFGQFAGLKVFGVVGLEEPRHWAGTGDRDRAGCHEVQQCQLRHQLQRVGQRQRDEVGLVVAREELPFVVEVEHRVAESARVAEQVLRAQDR
jgi:hypothetical protein